MQHDERDRIYAEANERIARAKRLIDERDQLLRQRGMDPEEARARARAWLEDPDMKRRLEEAESQARHEMKQSRAQEGSSSASPARRKAHRSMV